MSSTLPNATSRATFETLDMFIGTFVYLHNQRYLFSELNQIFRKSTPTNRVEAQIRALLDNSFDSTFYGSFPFLESIIYLENYENQGQTYEELIENGFAAKNKNDSSWTATEVKMLKEACTDIQLQAIIPQVQDLAYYISHYIFQGTKSKKEVEGMINKQIRQMLEKKQINYIFGLTFGIQI